MPPKSSPLGLFYQNVAEREAVKEFLLKNLEERAIKAVFEKETVSGIYDAKQIINKAFERLDELYGIVPKPQIRNSR